MQTKSFLKNTFWRSVCGERDALFVRLGMGMNLIMSDIIKWASDNIAHSACHVLVPCDYGERTDPTFISAKL